jgi:chemotaxis protein methyltransferase CheR
VTEALDPAALADVAQALRRACGIVFSDPAGRPLRSGFASAAAALGLPSMELLRRIRARDPSATQAFVEAAVIGETYFGRHPEQLEALRRELRALPSGAPVTVWSAGCATGEEPYTLAMLLLEEGRRGTIQATDVSENALRVARLGRYGPWSLRGLPSLVRQRWLRPDGDGWVVAEELRRLVRFQRHNLLSDPAPGRAFDVVLCRNVMIYFERENVELVAGRLFDATRVGGLVALAPAEIPFAEPRGHTRVEFKGGALWRKAEPGRREPAPARKVAGANGGPPPTEVEWKTPRPPPPPDGAVAPEPPVPPPPADPLAEPRRAASEGRWLDAERGAVAEGERSLSPGPYLFASAAAEARGDLKAAVHWLGRALFLVPDHAVARAGLVPMLERLGRKADAALARREALRALEGTPDDQLLPGVEPIAAGALRSALLASLPEEESA